MRAQSCVGPQTRLEVVTEGVLTRMIQRDPELNGVGLVILDEFHERSLQADLALALLLDVQQGLRDDLKLLIMSATLDNGKLQQRLPDAPQVVSEGRAWPVERRYQSLPAQLRFDEAVVIATADLLRHETGSLLLFLPGVGEILRVQEHLPRAWRMMCCYARCMARCLWRRSVKRYCLRRAGCAKSCWRPILPKPV